MVPEAVLKEFKGKQSLVTGGSGLIGRQVVKILDRAGAKVRIVSLDRIKVSDKAEHVYGDLTDFGLCKELMAGMDYVFHLAGIKGSIEVTKKKPASFFVPLLMMNTNVLEACRLSGVKKAVYTSSIGAYASAEIFRESEDSDERPPMDLFPGWAKRMAEFQIKAYKIQYGLENFAVVRPCNVYGPGDNFDPANAMVIPSLMARIRSGEDPVVIWGDGSAIRDFAYSEDVAAGVILALYYGTGGGFINLGSGQGYTVKALVETLRGVIDFKYRFDTDKPSGFPKRVMDISAARERLNYRPEISLAEGLERTWEWYLENEAETAQRKNYFKGDGR